MQLKIVIGDTFALTTPNGWNGLNSLARNIDGDKVTGLCQCLGKDGTERALTITNSIL